MAGSSKKAIIAALVGNLLVSISKFTAAVLTGSSAMLAEGIHSVVDTGNQGLLLHGLRQAGKPPDQAFPFGRGKEVYFWSFVVAILIFAVGAGVSLYEGIIHLLEPQPVHEFLPSYIVLALALAFEGGAWWFALREFRKSKGERNYFQAVRQGKDPSMFLVLFEDSAALLGILAAALGVALTHATGNPLWDASASVAIGLILGVTALWLAVETKGLLIGESASNRVVTGIRELVESMDGVLRVGELLTMHLGPQFILVNISLEFEDSVTVPQLEERIAAVDQAIKTSFPRVKKIFIEAECLSRHAHPDLRHPVSPACATEKH